MQTWPQTRSLTLQTVAHTSPLLFHSAENSAITSLHAISHFPHRCCSRIFSYCSCLIGLNTSAGPNYRSLACERDLWLKHYSCVCVCVCVLNIRMPIGLNIRNFLCFLSASLFGSRLYVHSAHAYCELGSKAPWFLARNYWADFTLLCVIDGVCYGQVLFNLTQMTPQNLIEAKSKGVRKAKVLVPRSLLSRAHPQSPLCLKH